MQKLLWLSLAGALGTLARYGLSDLVYRVFGAAFPWGTLVVNVVGCSLFGAVWVMAEEEAIISHETRFIVLTGFMGAFTTFSTFAFETTSQLRYAQWLPACGNILASNLLGLASMFVGMALARLL